MEENDEFRRRNFARQLEKYSLEENQELGECVEMFKKEYDPEKEYFNGTTQYDAKCIRLLSRNQDRVLSPKQFRSLKGNAKKFSTTFKILFLA